MKILLVADGRSPITKNWIQMLSGLKHELVLVSTYPCKAPAGIELAGIIPAGFSSFGGGQSERVDQERSNPLKKVVGRFRPIFLKGRALLTPLMLGAYQKKLNTITAEIQPDLIHAMRIPFEGMLAAAIPASIPVVMSIWGNDLTLHAKSSFGMSSQTRKALQRADGLMADAKRDTVLAQNWGFNKEKPTLVVPGGGGLDIKAIRQATRDNRDDPIKIPAGRTAIVNPRGFRPGSVHQDVFFESIPIILEAVPEAFFICAAMSGQLQAEKRVQALGIADDVLLLPYLEQQALWQLFAKSEVYVSLSSHDGTPNTFLEALACGCFPVVGDIASLREWLDDGDNGLLVNPKDPKAAAVAVIQALKDESRRKRSKKKNREIIKTRADRQKIRESVDEFYRKANSKT